jgi:uncharacterized protein (DUF427 family)
MSIRMRDAMKSRLGELRYEPTEKRVRAVVDGTPVVDSTRAVLVWEPRRVVPSYAVPASDVAAELRESPDHVTDPGTAILHPGIPFAIHSTPGAPLDLHFGAHAKRHAAFRPADPHLDGHVVLDWHAFDAWYEEDEQLLAHPRDPYHRVDVRRTSRRVRIELGGDVIAESHRASLLFETSLPTRFYLPREDVTAELKPSDLRTSCAYKGTARYWSIGAHENIGWTYEDPLVDASGITGLVAFWDELVDVTVDGELRRRPRTPFSKALVDEFGVAAA